jgi:hypothetical protein
MKARFNIYEVEHSGDEQESVADLSKAGCTEIEVVDRDHEAGYITVKCELPEGVSEPSGLTLEYACL